MAQTDDSGQVVIPIHLSSDISIGVYHVNVSAEKNDFVNYPNEKEIQITDEIKTLNVLLDRDKESYSPGEEVNVSYVVTKEGDLVNANVRYQVFRGEHDKIYEMSYATDGNIKFTVPADFNQDHSLYLMVYAKLDQETTGSEEMEIPVHELQLLLNADQTEYAGGESIEFEYELIGSDQTTSEVYKVIDDQDDIIDMNETVDGQFEFQVPAHPAETYTVRLEVVTEGGAHVEESIELRRISRIQLEISIETDSSYTSDVYEPGDEIEVRYKLRPLGDAKMPEKITLWYSFLGMGQEERIQTSSNEGTFTVEIPEEISGGTYFLQVLSHDANQANIEPVRVEEDPSILSLRVLGSLSLLGLLGIILLFMILGLGYYTLSSRDKGAGISCLKLSNLFKKKKGEQKEKDAHLEPTEKSEEKVSPAEEAHGWKGPEKKETETIDQVDDTEDSDQIEPDEDW